MAKPKTKHARKKRSNFEERFVRPTEQREAHNDFQAAGAAKRVTPAIDTLLRRKYISEAEWASLTRYRQQADMCNRSYTRDSCDFSVRGGEGNGPGAAVISAKREVARMDKELGSLRPLVWAVVVEDQSITQWLVTKYGSIKKQRKDEREEMTPNCTKFEAMFARFELKFAAKRLEA